MLCDAKKEKGKDKENDDSSPEMLAGTRTHARIAKNNARASPLNLPSPPAKIIRNVRWRQVLLFDSAQTQFLVRLRHTFKPWKRNFDQSHIDALSDSSLTYVSCDPVLSVTNCPDRPGIAIGLHHQSAHWSFHGCIRRRQKEMSCGALKQIDGEVDLRKNKRVSFQIQHGVHLPL